MTSVNKPCIHNNQQVSVEHSWNNYLTCLKCILVCFLQLPKDDEILSQKLREEARASFLQRRGRQLLNNNELKVCMEIQCVTFYIGCRDLVLGHSMSIHNSFGVKIS